MKREKQEADLADAVDMAAFTARAVGPSAAATFVAAIDGTIVSWSEEAERLFGRPLWAALGRPCHEVVGGRFTDGQPACAAVCPVRLESRLGVSPPSYDMLVKPPFRGAGPRLVRVHHVVLRDPIGYVSGLLHVVDAGDRPRKAARRAAAS